jgi:hemerythrin-like domain-containing protein
MTKAIEDLRNEHTAILAALQTLAAISKKVEKGQDYDRKDVHAFIGFLKEFADKCHHGKEEGILFPALVKAGMPEKGGPVGVMLAEHAQGRELIKQMEAAFAAAPKPASFVEAARKYSALLEAHIGKENEVLFPAAEQALPEAQMAQIFEAFEQHEEKAIGAGRHEELHALLRKLKQKYMV